MVALKRKRKDLQILAERLDLPETALPGAARVVMTEGRSARIENHHGVLEQSSVQIRIRTGTGCLAVSGEELELKAMDRKEMLVCGRIRSVEWE